MKFLKNDILKNTNKHGIMNDVDLNLIYPKRKWRVMKDLITSCVVVEQNSHIETLTVLKSILPCKVSNAHQQSKQTSQSRNGYAILRWCNSEQSKKIQTYPPQNDNIVNVRSTEMNLASYRPVLDLLYAHKVLLFLRLAINGSTGCSAGSTPPCAPFALSSACAIRTCFTPSVRKSANVLTSYKKVAFTLAEVLITLGIIGVVAAITIPQLIRNYKAQVLRTQFLQANTILHDGIQKAKLDDADMNEIINNRDYEKLYKYFKKGDCKLPASASAAGYRNYFDTRNAAGAEASKFKYPYCISNGMVMWIGTLNISADGYNWSATDKSLIAIDINGWNKKPNKYGHDVFFYFYDNSKGVLIATGTAGLQNLLGLQSNYGYYISCPGGQDHSEAGIGCTAKALFDTNYFKNLQ